MSDGQPVLSIKGLRAYYGESQALHGVDLQVANGEIVSLLGRNGAGKSTTLKSIIGAMPSRSGSILFHGRELIGKPPEMIGRQGIAWCPEDRGIFSSLSVEENLLLPPFIKDGGYSIEEIYTLFPNLRERRREQGTRLSGGEQQMLAIARILRTGADFLLLDEPTEGLAPVIVERIGQVLLKLRERKLTVLLVEQNFRFAATIADRHYVMEDGRVVDHFRTEEMAANLEKLKRRLGV